MIYAMRPTFLKSTDPRINYLKVKNCPFYKTGQYSLLTKLHNIWGILAPGSLQKVSREYAKSSEGMQIIVKGYANFSFEGTPIKKIYSIGVRENLQGFLGVLRTPGLHHEN